MRFTTRINPGEIDYSDIEGTEKKLEQKASENVGSRPIDNLGKHEEERGIDLAEFGFEGELSTEGVLELGALSDMYLEALEAESEFIGEIMDIKTFEELEQDFGLEHMVTITERVEVYDEPKNASEAIRHYITWLGKRNNIINDRLENKESTNVKGKIETIKSWAAARTLAKNEYIQTISETMKDNPEDLATAITAIQFLSTVQLLTEADAVDSLDGRKGALMSGHAKAGANGILVGILLKTGDSNGKLFEFAKDYLPQMGNEKDETAGKLYSEALRKIESGVKAEVYAVNYLKKQLDEMDIEEIDGIEIQKTSKEEDIYGGDMKVIANIRGKRVGLVVDVKVSDFSGVYVLDNDGERVRAYDGAGESHAEPDAYQIPQSLVRLVQNPEAVLRGGAFSDLDALKAMSLRLPRRFVTGDREEAEYNDLGARTKNSLKWAFA